MSVLPLFSPTRALRFSGFAFVLWFVPVRLLALPTITTPDPAIAEVFRGNWENTLQPSKIQETDFRKRPWKVDLGDIYDNWYTGIDVKYQTRAYLFCEQNLRMVLIGWQHTLQFCRLANGAVLSSARRHPKDRLLSTARPHLSKDGTTITYPLRTSGSIDLLLTGDMIFRFSQDQVWLKENVGYLQSAADWLGTWIDDQGMLDSDDYDHDSLMRRGTDGTAQASAYLAFKKLAALQDVAGNHAERDRDEELANRLLRGARRHLWDSGLGYFYEYAEVNNIAAASRQGFVKGASSVRDPVNVPGKALDGIIALGELDPERLGAIGAGQSEWVTKGETVHAWIQIGLKEPTSVNRVILYNRQDPAVLACETFASGHLDFSDGSRVAVQFDAGLRSRAVVTFDPRVVTWVKFTADAMQASGQGNAGLNEFQITPTAEPYLKVTHGMSDVNFALVGYGVADEAQSKSVWKYFKAHEAAFYTVDGVNCPTWTTERPDLYSGSELNSINPNKDRTAFGRIWRHDAWMRRRMGDGAGIYQTIRYANEIYRLPSGGGPGFFGERYDLGRFKARDVYPDSTPKYAEYPSEYNGTVVPETLLGISADVGGVIEIDPCVPAGWYEAGFGIENAGVIDGRKLGFIYRADKITGWVDGRKGPQVLRVLAPPQAKSIRVLQDGREIPHRESGRHVTFTLQLSEGEKSPFSIE